MEEHLNAICDILPGLEIRPTYNNVMILYAVYNSIHEVQNKLKEGEDVARAAVDSQRTDHD